MMSHKRFFKNGSKAVISMPFLSNFLFSYVFIFETAMIAIHFSPHSNAGLNEPFITNFLSFGCSWFYFLCNFLFHFLVLLTLHCNYLHNYTCRDLCFPALRCIIETSDPSQLHSIIYVNANSSSPLLLHHQKEFDMDLSTGGTFLFALSTAHRECWYLVLLLLSATALYLNLTFFGFFLIIY